MSSAGMMPPPKTMMSAASRSREQLDDPGEEGQVGAGEHREPDDVGVLLDRRLDDLLRRLVQAGVDDLHAGVAQRPRHDLRAAVVAVETGLATTTRITLAVVSLMRRTLASLVRRVAQ